MWNLFKRLFKKVKPCKCGWKCDDKFIQINKTWSIEQKCLGATLSWAATPVPLYKWTKTCLKCGRKEITSGYVPLKSFPKDENGWPLNEDGTKMEIAND